ncbi:protein FAM185A-like [Watersipora subatra]|uniref:protein FAM185A-like n=1 Tax=Watersipora subatra TaxID=2589382 RepID=UPI00355BA72F
MKWKGLCLGFQRYCLPQCRLFHYYLDSVKPGTLLVNSPIDIHISPVVFNPQQTSFKSQIKLVSNELDSSAIRSYSSALDVSLKEEAENELSVSVPSELCQHALSLHVTIPHHYSVVAHGAGRCSLSISKLECDSAKLKLEEGNCELINMKVLDADINLKNGNLTFSNGFVGDVKALIDNGNLIADKLQGQNLAMRVMEGNVDIKSLYSRSCEIVSKMGDINIANCHGSTTVVADTGNVNINSADGELYAHAVKGDLNVHLAEYSSVELLAPSGSVAVSVSETAAGPVEMKTQNLDVDDSLILDLQSDDKSLIKGTLGSVHQVSSNSIKLEAHSTRLTMMDWITAQRMIFLEHPTR